MKLVTAEQMRQIDRMTIDEHGIPSLELMDNAGAGIARFIQEEILSEQEQASFTVFCGRGNNGGDGFVVGRLLHEAGFPVEIYYFGSAEKLSADSAHNLGEARSVGLHPIELDDVTTLPDELQSDFIIDAIFGTGFEGAPRDETAALINYINQQPQPVISIDLPSGLNADTGQHEGVVVQASHTLTLALPKYGLFVSPGRELAGFVNVISIGIPDEVISRCKLYDELITEEFVSKKLPSRKPDGHKGDFGKLFVLAGSTGLTGAAALAARSALRSGCGLVKIGCPRTVLPIIASSVVEATTMPLPDVARKGALAVRSLGEIRQAVSEHEAVVVGPGLGRHRETFELVRRLLSSIDKPCLVDADGINALENHLDILDEAQAELILTPHPGEFKRISGTTVPEEINERIRIARQFAIEHQTRLVLKGSPTIVADIDGVCYLNQTGNSGMATGGSGDVLSGVIGSLLAQGLEPLDAALCGVYVHGLAGNLATDDYGRRSMIASDIIDCLGEAFLQVEVTF